MSRLLGTCHGFIMEGLVSPVGDNCALQDGIRASSREGIEPEEVRLGDLEVGGLQVSTDLLLVLAVVY